MRKRIIHIIFGCLVSLAAYSQDTIYKEELPPQEDIVIEVPGEEERSEAPSYFEKLSPEDIAPRAIDTALASGVRSDEAYWYVNEAPVKKEKKKEDVPGKNKWYQQGWFNTLLWILLIGGFAGLLGWFLSNSNIQLFRRSRKIRETSVEEDAEDEDIFSTDFAREIAKAEGNGNYRMAIRLHYLQILQILSVKSLISYAPEKTNSEYVSALRNSPHYGDFFRLTRHFEYSWYGNFPVGPQAYAHVQQDFSQMIKRLKG